MPFEHNVSVIIPTWTQGDLLRKCLLSLRRQRFRDFEIIIVSNGAGDWAERLAREFEARLIALPENRGFAAGVNAGIEAGKAPLLLILNDDVELDPAWLGSAVAILEVHSDLSFCSGRIYKSDGWTIDDAGDALSMGGGAWRLGHGRPNGPEFDPPRRLFAVSLTAALFRRTVFEQVGNLDENFISYLEDMDLSLRLWRAGIGGVYAPDLLARHHGGASLGAESPERFRLMTRNQLLLLAKHYPPSFALSVRSKWSQILWLGMAIRKGMLKPYLAGLKQYMGLRRASFLRQCIRGRKEWSEGQRQAFMGWLRQSEQAIYQDLQARPRKQQDTYWRMYFALFRPKRSAASENAVGQRIIKGEVKKAGTSVR